MYTDYKNIHDKKEYYEQYTFPKRITQIMQWGKAIGETVKSQSLIHFCHIDFGASKKTIYEKKGQPRFVRIMNLTDGRKYEIVFYKEWMNGHKIILQFHLFEDTFFLGCHTFRYLPRDKFSVISKILMEKYLPGGFRGTMPSIISDNCDNQIRVIDNVFLNLVYLSGDEKCKNFCENSEIGELNTKKEKQRTIFAQLYSLL